MTIAELISALSQYGSDCIVYAYEGEITGIVIRSADNKKQLGYILCLQR